MMIMMPRWWSAPSPHVGGDDDHHKDKVFDNVGFNEKIQVPAQIVLEICVRLTDLKMFNYVFVDDLITANILNGSLSLFIT